MAIENKGLDNDPPELGRLRDTGTLWRVTSWGAAATLALAAAVLITQTDSGAQRLRLAFTAQPADHIRVADAKATAAAKLAQAQRLETQRLQAEVRALAADRERLSARVVSLEQNLNDMTGSIKRELAQVAATTPSPPPVVSQPTTTQPQQATEVATAGDAQAPPADHAAQSKIQSQIKSQALFSSTIDAEAEPKNQPEPSSEIPDKTADPAGPPPSHLALPAGAAVPLPPVRVASVRAAEPATPNRKPELGVDLGGARSMAIMHMRWATVKANFGPMLEGLHALVAHDRRPNAIPYRLLVGPIPNGAAAAQICSRMAASRVTCRTTRFAGEPLTQP